MQTEEGGPLAIIGLGRRRDSPPRGRDQDPEQRRSNGLASDGA